MANFDISKTRICGRGTTVTPALKEHSQKRVEECLNVMDVNVSACEVVLRHDAGHSEDKRCTCEITINVPKSTIRVQESGPDMYEAIDRATAKASRRLRRYKTRVIDEGRRRTRQRVAREKETFTKDVSKLIIESDKEAGLVRSKTIPLEPMTDTEAMLRIDMLGHDFYLYTDAMDGQPSVIYRRNDGGYGILHGQPE